MIADVLDFAVLDKAIVETGSTTSHETVYICYSTII
jgi:hypothetical protein